VIAPLHAFDSINKCAVVKQTACIAGYSEAIVPVKLPLTYRKQEVILERIALSPAPVLVGSSLCRVEKDTAYLKLLNFKHHYVTLKRTPKSQKNFIFAQHCFYY